MLHHNASVLQGLAELKNKNPAVIEVTEDEFVSHMRNKGVPEWEIGVHLFALKAGTQIGGPDGFRICLKDKK